MFCMRFRWIAAFVAFGAACAAQADILHLRDGTRYPGHFVRQTATEVEFRIQLGGGKSTVVRRFPLSRVKSIEKGPLPDEPRAKAAPASVEPAAKDMPDVAQMLREAFELLDDGDQPAALRAMQKSVTQATPEALVELERYTRGARGRELADLMAATRIALAALGRAQHGFDIRGATAYEMPALGVMLEGAQVDALREEVAGRSLAAWAGSPLQFSDLTPDARVLVEKTRRAAAIIAVRLRIDPRVRQAGSPRAGLVKLRDELAVLATHVSSLPGFTALSAVPTPDDDPTLIEAQRLTELAAEMAAAATQPTSQPVDEESPATQPADEEQRPDRTAPVADRPER
jgi:hypothetical protein